MLPDNLPQITFIVITEIVSNNSQYYIIYSKQFLTLSMNSFQMVLNLEISEK